MSQWVGVRPLNSGVRRQSRNEVHIVKSSKVVVILVALAAAFGSLAIGLLAAKEIFVWVLALPKERATIFTIVSYLVSAALLVVALMFTSKRKKAS